MSNQIKLTATARRAPSVVIKPLPFDGLVLSLDVSSSAVGWAYFNANYQPLAPVFGVAWPRPRSAPSLQRIDQLVSKTLAVARGSGVVRVVMEWTAGKKHGAIRRATSGLAVFGQAQGEIRRALLDGGFEVETVSELEWTGRVSKERRADRIALEFPEYRKFRDVDKMDGGLDCADAIGLGLWYLARARLA